MECWRGDDVGLLYGKPPYWSWSGLDDEAEVVLAGCVGFKVAGEKIKVNYYDS